MGLLVSVLEYDIEHNEIDFDLAVNLCTIIFATTIALMGFTILRYNSLLIWLKIRKEIRENETFYSSGYLKNKKVFS